MELLKIATPIISLQILIGASIHNDSYVKTKTRYIPTLFLTFYALFNSSLSLSAIIAINSLLVGFPRFADTVYPKIFSTVSACPLPHATSIAWRIS